MQHYLYIHKGYNPEMNANKVIYSDEYMYVPI
jgi:hypothetical protein